MSADRLLIPVYLLIFTFIAGTLGYYAIGLYGLQTGVAGTPWTMMNCAFMTAISLTTVGYKDYLGLDHYPLAQVYTIGLLFSGMGVVLYGVSEATSFFVEGHLGKIVERRRNLKAIQALDKHIVVCGIGDTGEGVIHELSSISEPFVAIDHDKERSEKILELFPRALLITADSLDEDTLKEAGIERARGLIACLADDRDTLFLTITARFLNPSVTIIAKADALGVAPKMKAAGATQVVTPTFTGGRRLASELIRPHVTSFLDTMLRDAGNFRFGEVELRPGTSLAGAKLSQAGIREKTGLNIIAVKDTSGACHYNVDVERNLEVGDVLIAIGSPKMLEQLRELCA